MNPVETIVKSSRKSPALIDFVEFEYFPIFSLILVIPLSSFTIFQVIIHAQYADKFIYSKHLTETIDMSKYIYLIISIIGGLYFSMKDRTVWLEKILDNIKKVCKMAVLRVRKPHNLHQAITLIFLCFAKWEKWRAG